MDAIEKQTESNFLDSLYTNLIALRESIMIIENKSHDYFIQQQLTVNRRAIESELYEIKQRIEHLEIKVMEPGA